MILLCDRAHAYTTHKIYTLSLLSFLKATSEVLTLVSSVPVRVIGEPCAGNCCNLTLSSTMSPL